MKEIRCPDCGYRMTNSQCPICFKRVPFPSAATKNRQKAEPKWERRSIPSFPKAGSRRRSGSVLKTIPVLLAAICAIFSLTGEVIEQVSMPEDYVSTYYEDYLEAGAAGAEDMPTMEACTIYDDKGIRVTVDSIGLVYDTPALAVTIFNNSERNVTVSVDSAQVNGYMIDVSGLYCEVKKGKTAQTLLRLNEDDLQNAGIDTVADVVLLLDIYDTDNYEDIVSELQIPLQTSAAGYVQKVDDSGTVVYEDGGVRLLFRKAEVDEYGDGKLLFFAENLTEDPVYIGDDGISVNGMETDGMLWCRLWPGTRCIETVYLFDVTEQGIEESGDITQICIELYVENAVNWERTEKTAVIDMG